jgi:pSer/pThr/pTyr-binding forkhead associated (FHA) protein
MATLRLVPSLGSVLSSASTIEITAAETMVGREPGCDMLLSDGSVSRKHAKIERRGHIWAVVDQGSANGTYIDSQKIGEGVLKNGQEIRFGTVSFRVEIPPDDADVTVAGTPLPEATVLATPAPAAPKWSAPPPIPKASPPGPAASSTPPPPSAAAAKERFRSSPAPASSPVPQMSSPPPPRKGRGPVFWVFTGCCGCLLLVLFFAAALGGGLFFLTMGASDAARATLRQVKQGDLDGAYAGLAPGYRAEMSREEFEALVERHPGLKSNMDATFWSRSVVNDRATLTGVLTADGGTPERVTIELRKDGGVWKISKIRFEDSREGRSRSNPLPAAA